MQVNVQMQIYATFKLQPFRSIYLIKVADNEFQVNLTTTRMIYFDLYNQIFDRKYLRLADYSCAITIRIKCMIVARR